MTWSSADIAVLARAVSHAPSVHNTQPWTLEAHADHVDLYERFEGAWGLAPRRGPEGAPPEGTVALPRHDPAGRDRTISCGAALANLALAVRALGWAAEVALLPEPAQPGLVARIHARGRANPTATETERYAAIFRRHSYRGPFGLEPVPRDSLRGLAGAASEPGVQIRIIEPRTECGALAELFGHAALVIRDDSAYQRELAAWSVGPSGTTVPWGGLVRADTHVPDTVTLTERLMHEGILLLLTPDDTRLCHLVAGAAMQQVWLAAIVQGMVAAALTQPLHLPEVRAGLIERLGLAGYPQLFLRVGHPARAELSPQESRRPADSVVFP
ncbi:MAG TPA: hypothetical protein VJT49_25200 [Amycolatopsis sp.]|uniref:hypothetical protein n=1 Tax=Amycolatopsis sp. TaxID=37632 RepID=UPI002B49BEC1|nr:hypothetical protein [Amycolatopsis sp.]HKS48347.1 hypothetical protein [Amycolatopsis sp.]